MTTLGDNIQAVEVDGSFDDCQALVKSAFNDAAFRQTHALVSANSINISRLLPQTLYYISALQQLGAPEKIAFSVPSGNFGNIFAAMLVRAMGVSGIQVIAATNANDTFVKYLENGRYQPQRSLHTLSNAMDVGAPSNLERIQELIHSDVNVLRSFCWAASVSDESTVAEISRLLREHDYLVCPHTAVGVRASRDFVAHTGWRYPIISLATAHPAKFADVLQNACSVPVHIPDTLQLLALKRSQQIEISNSYHELMHLIKEL